MDEFEGITEQVFLKIVIVRLDSDGFLYVDYDDSVVGDYEALGMIEAALDIQKNYCVPVEEDEAEDSE